LETSVEILKEVVGRLDPDTLHKFIKEENQKDAFSLHYIPECKETMLICVAFYGFTLEFASKKLKDDREIVLVAVKQDGCTRICI
jgi:hypothetical protein